MKACDFPSSTLTAMAPATLTDPWEVLADGACRLRCPWSNRCRSPSCPACSPCWSLHQSASRHRYPPTGCRCRRPGCRRRHWRRRSSRCPMSSWRGTKWAAPRRAMLRPAVAVELSLTTATAMEMPTPVLPGWALPAALGGDGVGQCRVASRAPPIVSSAPVPRLAELSSSATETAMIGVIAVGRPRRRWPGSACVRAGRGQRQVVRPAQRRSVVDAGLVFVLTVVDGNRCAGCRNCPPRPAGGGKCQRRVGDVVVGFDKSCW